MRDFDLERCKKDPVYFVETYLKLELLPWQKAYLKTYQVGQNIKLSGVRSGKRMIYNSIKVYEKFISK